MGGSRGGGGGRRSSIQCCAIIGPPAKRHLKIIRCKKFCNHLDGEERASYFSWFVLLVSTVVIVV